MTVSSKSEGEGGIVVHHSKIIFIASFLRDEQIIRTHSLSVWISSRQVYDGWHCLQMRWDNIRASYSTDHGNEPSASQMHNEGQIDYAAHTVRLGNLFYSSIPREKEREKEALLVDCGAVTALYFLLCYNINTKFP